MGSRRGGRAGQARRDDLPRREHRARQRVRAPRRRARARRAARSSTPPTPSRSATSTGPASRSAATASRSTRASTSAGAPEARLPRRRARGQRGDARLRASTCSATSPAARVLILGVAYRGGVKETAFSRRVRAARRARRRAARRSVAADPLYDDDELRGARLRALGRRRRSTPRSLQADHAEYRALTPADLPGARAVVDGRGVARPGAVRRRRLRRIGRRRGSERRSSARDDALARVAVAVELGPLRPAAVRSSAASAASRSRSTSTFQPASTVSIHSVVSRSVTHGTPAR